MNRINLIDSFLRLVVEISKNDIAIDFNLVYSNLVTFGIKNEDITHCFDMWIIAECKFFYRCCSRWNCI